MTEQVSCQDGRRGCRWPAGRARAAARGFTLVEVILALSLTALIMLALISALATFGKTASSLEARFERSDDVRLVSEFLRATLGRAIEDYKVRQPGDSPRVMFEGNAAELRWVGVMPARHGVGGVHNFRLFAFEDAFGPALALQYQPFVGEGAMPDWSGVEPRVLVERLAGFEIAYFGRDADAWTNAWEDPEAVPALVRLGISVGEDAWPEVLVRIRPAGGDARGVRIVHGPV